MTLYYGVWPGTVGHYTYDKAGNVVRFEQVVALGPLAPAIWSISANQPQSGGVLRHVADHTVLSMWDRTGDINYGSVSAFITDGTLDFSGMCLRASTAFPEVWRRISYRWPPYLL